MRVLENVFVTLGRKAFSLNLRKISLFGKHLVRPNM